MRDEAAFRAALADEPCWDSATEALFLERGEPLRDCLLQNREELIALCELIETRGVRSWLEVGAWTGRLTEALHRLFRFDTVAVCDDGYCRRFGFELHTPADARVFVGSSRGEDFEEWRRELGHVDLVFIDADHSYRGVRRDFEIQRTHPHRFLAFHDISGSNRHTRGVARFWRELEGDRLEILRPHRELGLDYTTMGIGLWSATEPL